MDETTAFDAVRSSTLEVLPELDPAAVTPDRSLSDLGANSIDRTEITTLAMERLDVSVPVTELQGVRDIAALVRLLRKHG
ncbi:phosphopantetheine-binding protein [Streptomyces tendae]|uniref:phosphopantetheine-binding protein n=1 Tax=Streptomyces tendae TaxID=1932 RepID=UPI0036CD5A04